MNNSQKSSLSSYSKSFLVLFVLQLLASAACISTANAGQMQFAPVSAHCQNKSMAVLDHAAVDHHLAPSSCNHCDSQDMGLSAQVTVTPDMTPVLLSIISLPEAMMLTPAYRSSLTNQRAPPHSAALLYHTTQRILV